MEYLLRLKTKRHGWLFVSYAEECGMTGTMVFRFTDSREKARAMSYETADFIASTQSRAAKIERRFS